jgi:hypothetical protein
MASVLPFSIEVANNVQYRTVGHLTLLPSAVDMVVSANFPRCHSGLSSHSAAKVFFGNSAGQAVSIVPVFALHRY